MDKRNDYIRVRVTTDEKKLIKEVAKELNTDMSKLILVATKNIVEKHREKMLSQQKIEDRANRTEKKLSEIKIKLSERRTHENEKVISKIFQRIKWRNKNG